MCEKLFFGPSLFFLFLLCLTNISCEGRDFYKILGVPRNAPTTQIKKAFRSLSIKYHPDKNSGSKERYIDINDAYQVLKDKEKRALYDQYGEKGMQQAARQGEPHGHDPFSDFFFSRRYGTGGITEGESFEVELVVSLRDLYTGKEIKFLHRKHVSCSKCGGSGTENPEDVVKCSACGGTGRKTTNIRVGPGVIQRAETTCSGCGGKGVIFKTTCPYCKGTKIEIEDTDNVIIIEKGFVLFFLHYVILNGCNFTKLEFFLEIN